MLGFINKLVCQLFHARWAETVSYSRHGAWKCTKPGCAAQARHDRASASSRGPLAPILVFSPRRRSPASVVGKTDRSEATRQLFLVGR
jgi:hypothetical protein